ncbi:uncharacterized protein Bfra_004254 [Botrytis fragariae]|uniref:BTB domain-containing protein n=1 Tax=Botrytis fragariae TaxID=1964551 RepID=A0A8H6EJ89_9HELO|nr:uncharacterized protein Bfra_004254 [Botrytis fragariae]KAF5874247.1 hypothetical protein Bfra_004254 [Botrytis fragariae]
MSSCVHEHASSGIVTVIVSPEGRPFFFHETLLCQKSPWFRSHLESQVTEDHDYDSAVELSPIESSFQDFQQTQRKVIYRYEDDIHTFNQFFSWVYGSTYPLPRRDPENYSSSTHISEWVILHQLAIEMGVMDLAHKALSEYVLCRDTSRTGYWMPLPAEIQFIYQNQATTYDLRSLTVLKMRCLYFSTGFEGLQRELSDICGCHPGFHTDVFAELQRHSEQVTRCNYEDCSIHNPHNTTSGSLYIPTSNQIQNSNSPLEVESPPLPSSEYLDDISTLDLDSSPPNLSDCGTISTEQEDANSEQARIEAMVEYHESRDKMMTFDGGEEGRF